MALRGRPSADFSYAPGSSRLNIDTVGRIGLLCGVDGVCLWITHARPFEETAVIHPIVLTVLWGPVYWTVRSSSITSS